MTNRGKGGRPRTGTVIKVGDRYKIGVTFPMLETAGVERPDLFASDATRKPMTWHDLRASACTWWAVRGDEPLRIQQRAGHTTFSTTQRYIREAEAVRDGFGEVFPELPQVLEGSSGFDPVLIQAASSSREHGRKPGSRTQSITAHP